MISLLIRRTEFSDLFSVSFTLIILLPALLIILIQYPLLNSLDNWLVRLFIFYFSALVFAFIFGALSYLRYEANEIVFKNIVESVKAGLSIAFLSHIAGLGFLPIILMINFFFQKQFFYQNIQNLNKSA